MSRTQRTRLVSASLVLVSLLGGVAYLLWRPSHEHLPILSELNIADAHPLVIEAIEKARDEVLRNPESSEHWGRLGSVLAVHDSADDAIRCFGEAARLDPSEFRWQYYPAILLEATDLVLALRHYEKAVALRLNYAPLRCRLGKLLMRFDRLDEAKRQFDRAIVLSPEMSNPQAGLGRVSMAREKYAEAQEYFESSIALASWDRQAHVGLARARFLLGDVDGAYRAQRQAERLTETPRPYLPDPVYQEINIWAIKPARIARRVDDLLARGDLVAAELALKAITDARPDLARPRLNLGHVLEQRGDLAGAVALYRDLVERFPEDELAHFHLGLALERQGDIDGAIACYRHCTQLKQDFTQAHYATGLVMEKHGREDEAVRAYQATINADPRFAPAQLALGVLLQKLRRFDEAVKHIERAVKLAPSDPIPRKYLEDARKARLQETEQG